MRIKTICKISLFVAIIAVCSAVTVPFAVPFTLQTFGIFLCAYLLGRRDGTIAISVYIILGCTGLPIFSGFRGGISVILGLTGGYIIGFIFVPLLVNSLHNVVGGVCAMLVVYGLGCAWYATVSKSTVLNAVAVCVLPFFIFDIMKIMLAKAVADKIKKAL